MKKLIFIVLSLLTNSLLFSQQNQLYPIKAAKIDYAQVIGDAKINITLCFDDFGGKICINQLIIEGNNSHQLRTIYTNDSSFILISDNEFSVINRNKEGEINKSCFYLLDKEKVTEDGIQKSGTTEFLGKICDIYSLKDKNIDLEYISWKGILLIKKEKTFIGETSLEAKSIVEKSPDASWFELPEGVEQK